MLRQLKLAPFQAAPFLFPIAGTTWALMSPFRYRFPILTYYFQVKISTAEVRTDKCQKITD
jgi:hypothetical protein